MLKSENKIFENRNRKMIFNVTTIILLRHKVTNQYITWSKWINYLIHKKSNVWTSCKRDNSKLIWILRDNI